MLRPLSHRGTETSRALIRSKGPELGLLHWEGQAQEGPSWREDSATRKQRDGGAAHQGAEGKKR